MFWFFAGVCALGLLNSLRCWLKSRSPYHIVLGLYFLAMAGYFTVFAVQASDAVRLQAMAVALASMGVVLFGPWKAPAQSEPSE